MRKLKNPYIGVEGYNCFACSPRNTCGLQMTFHEDGEELVCHWEPSEHFAGFPHLLHGSIQATMMDEIASWLIFINLGTAGVTSKMEVSLRRTTYTNRGTLCLRARLKTATKKRAVIQVRLLDADDNLCSQGLIEYVTFSPELAGKEAKLPRTGSLFPLKSLQRPEARRGGSKGGSRRRVYRSSGSSSSRAGGSSQLPGFFFQSE